MIDISAIGKPTNTVISAGSRIDNETITGAIEYLTQNYHNLYNVQPHVTYTLCPFPEYNLEKILPEIDRYFQNHTPIVMQTAKLTFEPEKLFFSLPLIGEALRNIHADFVELFNTYRDGYVRERDIQHIQEGKRTDEEIERIKTYGYFRILDHFTPHITIGNVEADMSEISSIEAKLEDILKNVIGKDITVDRVQLAFQTDSDIKSEMKDIFRKEYVLG